MLKHTILLLISVATTTAWRSSWQMASFDRAPTNATIPIRLDNAEQHFHFPITAGESMPQILARACAEYTMCGEQPLLRSVIVAHYTKGNDLAYYLLVRCGSTGDQTHPLGWIKSNVASFFQPLLPQNDGVDIFLPLLQNDWVSDVVSSCGVWEPGMTLLTAAALSPLNKISTSHLFIDVGSHVGWYSLFASKVMGVTKVLSFECLPEIAVQNMRGILKNSAGEKIRLSVAAIGAADGHMFVASNEINRGGTVVMGGYNDNSTAGSEYATANIPDGAFSVPVTSLDRIFYNQQHRDKLFPPQPQPQPSIRLIKSDVNPDLATRATDADFIQGMHRLVAARAVDYILLEMGKFSASTARVDALAYMLRAGYVAVCLEMDGGLGIEAGTYSTVHGMDQLRRYRKELQAMVGGNRMVATGNQQWCHNVLLCKSEGALERVVELATLVIDAALG